VHGLARALVANAVHGVTQGFKKELDIVGVGYRAELKGKAVAFALGKSHPVEFAIPEGIQIAVDKQTHLIVSGADKAQVGQVAADLRSLRPPDPYKQKGVRITGSASRRKPAKQAQRPERNRAKAPGFSPAGISKRRKLWHQHQFAGYRDRQNVSAFISAFALTVVGTQERPRLCVYRSIGHNLCPGH